MKITKTTKMKTLLNATAALLIFGTLLTSCTKNKGCTDPAATNFDVEATKDDGSCLYAEVTTENTTASITFNFTHHFNGVPVTVSNFNQFNYVTANNDTISMHI